MTPFEKMDAISAYLREPGRFKYLTRYNDHTVDLAADPNEPFFVTYRWNSRACLKNKSCTKHIFVYPFSC